MPTAASPWRLLLMPSLVTFTAKGDAECWLTPDHLLVFEQCLRARQFYGYSPLASIGLGFESLFGGSSLFRKGVKKVRSIVASVSPSTVVN